ncbi:hypothetical protein TNCV_333991 [Trichonephila clavipes]|nr:hypothetical protein TNCV_333991 [Trichonephila clavipes]
MDSVDFLHDENPPNWAGVEAAALGIQSQRQTNRVRCELEQQLSYPIATLLPPIAETKSDKSIGSCFICNAYLLRRLQYHDQSSPRYGTEESAKIPASSQV